MNSNNPFRPPTVENSHVNSRGVAILQTLVGFAAVFTLLWMIVFQWSETRGLPIAGLESRFGIPPCVVVRHNGLPGIQFIVHPWILAAYLAVTLTVSALLIRSLSRNVVALTNLRQRKLQLLMFVYCAVALGAGELYGLRSLRPLTIDALYGLVFAGVCAATIQSQSLMFGALVPPGLMIIHGAVQRAVVFYERSYDFHSANSLLDYGLAALFAGLWTALPCLVIVLLRLRRRRLLSDPGMTTHRSEPPGDLQNRSIAADHDVCDRSNRHVGQYHGLIGGSHEIDRR